MNITKEDVNELNAVVKVKLSREDYEPQVENVIKKHQKNARIPGFRPGKVPSSLIKKMYGKSILVEEVNKILSDKLYQYLQENQIEILGNPLPKVEDADKINWENPSDFEFSYDLGLAPKFELKLSGKDKLPYYVAKIDDSIIEKEVENICRRFGKYSSSEKSNEESLIYGEFQQLDDKGQAVEGGIKHTSPFAVNTLKDNSAKKQFTGISKGEKVTVDVKKAFENVTEIAHLLGITKEEAEKLNNKFEVTVTNISNVEKAELNQEIFDKVYGEGVVKDETAFREKIREDLGNILKNDSDRKLRTDVEKKILADLKLQLPDAFLKRWMLQASQKETTPEQIEKEYAQYSEGMKWRLVENKIAKENEVKLTYEEVKAFAKEVIRSQFMQYGYFDFPEDRLDEYADKYLEREEEARRIQDSIISNKVFDILKEKFVLDTKELPYEEFLKVANER